MRQTGFEPMTLRLKVVCSTIWATDAGCEVIWLYEYSTSQVFNSWFTHYKILNHLKPWYSLLTVLFRWYHFHFLSVKANLNDFKVVLSGRRWSRTTRVVGQQIYSLPRYPYGISTHSAFRRFATLGKDLFKKLSRVSFGSTVLTRRDLRIRIRGYAFNNSLISSAKART